MGVALQRTCTRITDNLRDALGNDGCDSLLARALARTEAAHPSLKHMRRLERDGIHLDGVAGGIETYGVTAVTAAIEALLTAMIEVLGRLIGDDMAIGLIDQGAARPPTNGKARTT